MASLPQSANDSLLISRTAVGEKVRNALRLYVGRGRRYSVKELSNATGVPDRCIEAAKCDPDDPEYRPLKLEDLASLTSFLGAPFASAFLELAGLGAFELMDGQPPLDGVLTSGPTPVVETPKEKVARLSRELAAAVEEL